MKKNKFIEFDIKFTNLKVVNYSQNQLDEKFDVEKQDLIEFTTGVKFTLSRDEEKLVCIIKVGLIVLETQELFAELTVENEFHIGSIENILILNDKEDISSIPTSVLINFVQISVGTVRGILFEKLKGTIAQNQIYPLLDMNALFGID